MAAVEISGDRERLVTVAMEQLAKHSTEFRSRGCICGMTRSDHPSRIREHMAEEILDALQQASTR